MSDVPDPNLWRWVIEHVATPLLTGLWGALAYWVNTISQKFKDMDKRHEEATRELRDKLGGIEKHSAETYARRDDVREGFQQVSAKLDLLIDHALGKSQK